jgi:hypothetical protein
VRVSFPRTARVAGYLTGAARAAHCIPQVNHGATIIWHTMRMSDGNQLTLGSQLTLRQAAQLRTDIANVESGLEGII